MNYTKYRDTLKAVRECFESLRNEERICGTKEREAFKELMEEMVEFLLEQNVIGHENDHHDPVYDQLDHLIDYGLDAGTV